MAEPFIGEIRMFAGNFAPRDWAICAGQSMQISKYDALYALLGTAYGGDGRTNFFLPDLRGRTAVHQGQGAGLSNRVMGERFGTNRVTLSTEMMPLHSHPVQASLNEANLTDPTNAVLAKASAAIYSVAEPPVYEMPEDMVEMTGNDESHNNMMPYQSLNFIIALKGIFPSRN